MDREYQKRQLLIVLAPMVFTLAAIVALAWLPDRLLMTAAYPAARWCVIVGLLWMAGAWAVFQVRVSRRRREGQA